MSLVFFLQMTDVEAGGSTVFLDAETIIKPQKVSSAHHFLGDCQ